MSHEPGDLSLFPLFVSAVSDLPLIYIYLGANWASLVAQTVKNLPARQETQVRTLGGEDTLEKGMATHSSILTWRIP